MYNETRADLIAGEPELSEQDILEYFQRLALEADELHVRRSVSTLGHAYDAFHEAATRIPENYSDLLNIDDAHDIGGVA